MGWIWTTLAVAALLQAGSWAARIGFRQPPGAPRALAAATLAWVWLTVGIQILGPLGYLARGPLALWTVAGLAVAGALRFFRAPPDEERAATWPCWGLSGGIALGLVVWAALILGAISLMLPAKIVSDGPIYHLYFAARWWKEGRMLLIALPFGENAATYFPAGGDVWFAWLMAMFGGDSLAKVGQVPFLLMAAWAAFASARRLGVSAPSAAVATAWFVASTPLLLFSFEANVDTIFVAGYLVAVYFGLRYALGDGGGETLALAGLAAGCALGTKPTAMTFIPPLLLVGGMAVLFRPISWRKRLGHLALLAILPLVPAGYWFARSTWLTGNPLYPLHVAGFGRVWLRGWYDTNAMRVSQFYIPRREWRAFVDIQIAVIDPRLMPFWLAALLGVWTLGRRRQPHAAWTWGFAALALANVALYWLVIPYRTQQRFMLQALGLAAVPLGRLLDRGAWARWVAVALLGVHLMTPMSWPVAPPNERPYWSLTTILPAATDSPIHLPLNPQEARRSLGAPNEALGLALRLLAGIGAGVVAWAWTRVGRHSPALDKPAPIGQEDVYGPSQEPSTKRILRALALTATVIALQCLTLEWVSGASQQVFPHFRDYYIGWRELDAHCGPKGTRIAYAGTNLPYCMMGKDLRNDVRYINVDAHRDWLLHDYHRTAAQRGDAPTWPMPRPGWDRIHPDYDAWLANLRAARIQLLVVTRANPIDGPFNTVAEGFPIERYWADTHPETFELIYPLTRPDPLFRLYRVRPTAQIPPRS